MFISVSDGWVDTDVRIFDEDDDGCIHAGDLVDVLTTFGDKISKSEAKKLVQTADKKEGGLIDYEGMCVNELLCRGTSDSVFSITNVEKLDSHKCWRGSVRVSLRVSWRGSCRGSKVREKVFFFYFDLFCPHSGQNHEPTLKLGTPSKKKCNKRYIWSSYSNTFETPSI